MRGSTADSPPLAPPSGEPSRSRWLTLLDAACRTIAAIVFLMAAVTKITALRAFSDQLVLHSTLPGWLAVVIAAVLPWLELTCGFCFLTGWAAREAAVVGVLLVLAFTFYLLFQRPETDCGCLVFPLALTPAVYLPSLLGRNLLLLSCCLRLACRGANVSRNRPLAAKS
jgi:putative oxidoreductase